LLLRARVPVSELMFGGSHRSAVLLVATLSRERAGGMQILYDRCAGIDIGKDIIAVAVRVPGEGPDGRKTIKRTFKTFSGVLRECARWLTGHDVTHVAMEATGIYSMPVYHALLAHGAFEVLVCNAGHVKNVPGRKTCRMRSGWRNCSNAGCCGARSCRPRRSRPPAT
jgi:Transposase